MIYIYYSWNLANVSYLCFGKCMHACICICDINMYIFIYRPQINIYIYTQNLCVSLFASGDGGGIKVWGWHVVEVEQNQWLDRTTWRIWKQWALILWWEKKRAKKFLIFSLLWDLVIPQYTFNLYTILFPLSLGLLRLVQSLESKLEATQTCFDTFVESRSELENIKRTDERLSGISIWL
jgi:hypothetical protein